MVFGGPNNYTGKDLRTGHSHLVQRGLNDGHFDTFAEWLSETLTDPPQERVNPGSNPL